MSSAFEDWNHNVGGGDRKGDLILAPRSMIKKVRGSEIWAPYHSILVDTVPLLCCAMCSLLSKSSQVSQFVAATLRDGCFALLDMKNTDSFGQFFIPLDGGVIMETRSKVRCSEIIPTRCSF
jgi:hypothetical protein